MNNKNTEKKSDMAPKGAMSLRPRAHPTINNEPTMTEQHHVEETSIRNIMRKYHDTGLVSHVNEHAGTYMDMINAPDFYEAQCAIAEAKSMFETVPSRIRQDFDNDPGKFLDFIQNPENKDKIEEYGLDSSHLPELPPQTEQSSTDAPQSHGERREEQLTMNLSQEEYQNIMAQRASQEASE